MNENNLLIFAQFLLIGFTIRLCLTKDVLLLQHFVAPSFKKFVKEFSAKIGDTWYRDEVYDDAILMEKSEFKQVYLRHQKAIAQVWRGDFVKAVETINAIASSKDENIFPQNCLDLTLMCHVFSGEYAKAHICEQQCRYLWKLAHSQNHSVRFLRGLIEYSHGRFHSAQQHFEYAVAGCSERAAAASWYYLSLIHKNAWDMETSNAYRSKLYGLDSHFWFMKILPVTDNQTEGQCDEN